MNRPLATDNLSPALSESTGPIKPTTATSSTRPAKDSTNNSSSEAIEQWVTQMREIAGGKPIAIMLEQSKGPLIYALMFRPDVILYPINPKQFARYRESYPGGDGKSDRSDARYLARMLTNPHAQTVDRRRPSHSAAGNLSEQRRKIVNDQVAARQQLIAHLKAYFPVLLQLFGNRSQLGLPMIGRWSDPRKLRADRQLVDRVLREHGIKDQQEREELIARLRSATLLTSDTAIIEPLSMACQLLAKQIRPVARSKSLTNRSSKRLRTIPRESCSRTFVVRGRRWRLDCCAHSAPRKIVGTMPTTWLHLPHRSGDAAKR